MQAVILAGGLGTRLWPLTKTVPKPMVPVGGKPYLEHQLRVLHDQGIRDILLLTGYLGEQIEEYFGYGDGLGLTIQYSREQSPLGTGGALREARTKLAEAFLLIYGDSYLPIDYTAALGQLEQAATQGLVVVYDNRLADTSVKNNIDVDADRFVTRYDKDSPDVLPYVEAGVLAFRRDIVDLIAPEGAVSLEKEIFPKLIAGRQLVAHITRERFYDIGTPDRLKLIEELLAI
jgi:mannose-1-phosphate guanylyltransferase